MSWSYSILSSSHKARQFEYRPNSTDENSEILFGTLSGTLYSVKLPSLSKKDVDIIDEDIYTPRYLGQFGKKDDAILGICWLRKQCNQYVVGSSRGEIHCGNTETYTSQTSNIIHEYKQFPKLTSVHLNSDDNYMLVSGYSNNAMICDLQTGNVVQEYKDIHTYHINISRFSNRSPNIFATSSFDKSIKLWDLRMKPNTPMYTLECSSGIVMISFSPDDSYVLASGLDNEIQQFRTLDGTFHTTFQIPKTGLDGNFTRAYYSSSGEYIVTGACEESNVSILSSVTGEMVGRDQVYPNRKHHSLYIQSLRGSPYSDNSICVLANYRELGDRELIMVSIPSPHDDDKALDKIVTKSNTHSTDTNSSIYTELPLPLNSTLCLPSFGISLEMNSMFDSCPLINFSTASLISSNDEINCDLYTIDPDIIESTGVDLLLIAHVQLFNDEFKYSQPIQTVAFTTHSFAMLARSNILRQRIKTAMSCQIEKDAGILRVIDISDIVPPNSAYLLSLLLKYLYAGDNIITVDNIKHYCLDNLSSKCTGREDKLKLLTYSNFKELPVRSSLWRNIPLCRLYVETLGHFMALANAWELHHLQALIDSLLCESVLNTTCLDILKLAEQYGRVSVRVKVMYHISLFINYIPLLPCRPNEVGIEEDAYTKELLISNPNLSQNLSPLVIKQLVDIRKYCRVNVSDREQTEPILRHQMSSGAENEKEYDGGDELHSLHALKSTHCKSMIIPKFWGHSIAKARNDNIIVIGGRDKFRDYRGSSLYSFNSHSNDWSLLNAAGDNIPPMMLYHVSLPLQKCNARHIVTIGGSRHPNTSPDDSDDTLGNVVNVLDMMTMSWSAPHVQFKQQLERKFEIYDRTRHSVVAIYKEDFINFGENQWKFERDNSWAISDCLNETSDDIANDILSTVRANVDHDYLSNQDAPQYSEHVKKRKQKIFAKVQKLYDNLCQGSSGLLTPPCDGDSSSGNNNIKPSYIYNALHSNQNLSYIEPVAWFILFGGLCDSDEAVKNDVHLLTCNARYYNKKNNIDNNRGDPEYEWEWSKPKIRATGELPRHRLGHSAVCITGSLNEGGNRMIVYGGVGGNDAFDDVCSLRCNDDTTMIWEKVNIAGQSPGARYGHSMTSLPESNLMIMFGGKKSLPQSLRAMNDVWILRIIASHRDINMGISLQWEHIIFKGIPPTPRFEHRACEINGNMYIMGGMNYNEAISIRRDISEAEANIYALDTSKWEWIKPTCSFIGLQEEPIISTSYCSLHSDLLKLLYRTQDSKEIDSDITFNCHSLENDNDTQLYQFRAHSALLKARSNFIKAMLEANMKEASSKQVTIHCLESSVFYSLLIYLYTDTLRIQPEDSTLLLELANQYQIKRLEVLIEGYLSKQVHLTNILDLLNLSDIFGLEGLKLTCFSILLQNEKNDSILMKDIKIALSYNDENDKSDDNKTSISSTLIAEFQDFRRNKRHAYMIDVNDNTHRKNDINNDSDINKKN